MARIRVEFGAVSAGWLPLRIELADRVWEGAASFIPPPDRPTLDGLCDSLCDVLRGQRTRCVDFYLEPTVLEVQFTQAGGSAAEGDLRVELLERSDHAMTAPRELLFGSVLPCGLVVRTFHRALCRLEARSDLEDFEKYFAPFPSQALARLTDLVRKADGAGGAE